MYYGFLRCMGIIPHEGYNPYNLENHSTTVADPGFTEGGFRTVMRAMCVRKILGVTPTFDKPRPQNAFRKYRGHVAT